MSVWFTSDTHFWHKNIINYTDRPCDSVEEMNEKIINYWNTLVHKDDVVYHLGDVAFCGITKLDMILSRLKGVKHLVYGNHDRSFLKKDLFRKHWETIQPYKRLSGIAGAPTIILFHFPIAAWDEQGRGTWHLHGHSHGSYSGSGKILDVGIDGPLTENMAPLSLEEIMDYMKERPVWSADGHKVIDE